VTGGSGRRRRREGARGARDGARASSAGWGTHQQRGECASRTGQLQGAATGEEKAEGIRMAIFFNKLAGGASGGVKA